jgi:hypothetical protein
VSSTARKAKVGVRKATPGACPPLIGPTTVGLLHFPPQSVDLTALTVKAPVLRSKAVYATWIVPFGATAMSTPWLLGVPSVPPVEIVFPGEKVAPPSLDRLNLIGELPPTPWKSVHAT